MEAAAILFMVINCVLLGFIIVSIISNDDNVMRAHLKYANPDDSKDKGKLPKWIYKPEFLADPGHRKKYLLKDAGKTQYLSDFSCQSIFTHWQICRLVSLELVKIWRRGLKKIWVI